MAAPSPRRAGSGKMPVAVNPAPMAWERVAVLLLLGSRHPSWGTDHCQEGRIMDAPPRPVRGAREGIPRPRPRGDHADPRPRQEWCRGHGSDLGKAESISALRRAGWHVPGMGRAFQRATRHQRSQGPPNPPHVSGLQGGQRKAPSATPKLSGGTEEGWRRDVFPGAVLLTLPRLPAPSPRGGQVFALLPGNGARAKLAKI